MVHRDPVWRTLCLAIATGLVCTWTLSWSAAERIGGLDRDWLVLFVVATSPVGLGLGVVTFPVMVQVLRDRTLSMAGVVLVILNAPIAYGAGTFVQTGWTFLAALGVLAVTIAATAVSLRTVLAEDPWERPADNRCAICGYDLRGAAHDVCPECGTETGGAPPSSTTRAGPTRDAVTRPRPSPGTRTSGTGSRSRSPRPEAGCREGRS